MRNKLLGGGLYGNITSRGLQYLPVAQMMASTSSTQVPSLNRTPDDVRQSTPGRTCTLPDRIRLGRSSFVTNGLASMLWLGCSA